MAVTSWIVRWLQIRNRIHDLMFLIFYQKRLFLGCHYYVIEFSCCVIISFYNKI